ncbi:MAG: ABC transporter, partial [Lachnospiraceae bacterium]|nr:ABC transporter [Lachnospiraceae bacterium]
SSCGLLFLGAVAGLLSKDQASAGTVGSPLMMLVMIPPLFAGMNQTIEKMAVILPTASFQTILTSFIEDGRLMTQDNLVAVLVCMVWIIAGYTIFHVFYQRKGMDY